MLKRKGGGQHPFRGLLNRRGLGPFTIPIILLHIVSAIVLLIFLLVLTGYVGVAVPKLSIANEEGLLSNYVADALISLPNWDGECGCLAKSTITPEGEVIYPGLIPLWKLEKINGIWSKCHNEVRFCTVPYFIDKEVAGVAIIVRDLENNGGWNTWGGGSNGENSTVTRLVGIEYPDGRVHAGRLLVTVLY